MYVPWSLTKWGYPLISRVAQILFVILVGWLIRTVMSKKMLTCSIPRLHGVRERCSHSFVYWKFKFDVSHHRRRRHPKWNLRVAHVCRREGFPWSKSLKVFGFPNFLGGQGQFCTHGSIDLVSKAVWWYNFFKDRQQRKCFLRQATNFFSHFADFENSTQFNHWGPTKTLRDWLGLLPVTNVTFSKFRSCASDVVTNKCQEWERHGRRRRRCGTMTRREL